MRFGKLLFLFMYFLGLSHHSDASLSVENMAVEETSLKSSKPEAVGIDGKILTEKIDNIVLEAIRERATPGAVVAVIKDNKVIFEKAYGYHTYENQVETKVDDIFDLASISKIAATTLAVMRLSEEGKINLNETLGHYLEDSRNTNKANIRLKDVMLHQAGLIPSIPFHRGLKDNDYSSDSSATYPTKVADGFYLRENYFDEEMWPKILNSPTKPSGGYVYSDLSMYLMQKVIERQSEMPLDKYVKDIFYDSLGMHSTSFNPWKNYPSYRIVPTERDGKSFRDTLLLGFVHDQGAALANGVAGHAGLFSTARDLAIYGQLLLNRGSYGGATFLKSETIDFF